MTVDPPPEPAISVPKSPSVEFTPHVENSTSHDLAVSVKSLSTF